MCKDGECVEPSCALVDCKAPLVCKGGKCIEPGAGDLCLTCDSGPSDAGIGDASTGDDTGPGPGLGDAGTADSSSCGCAIPGRDPPGNRALLLGLASLVGVVVMRRRRR